MKQPRKVNIEGQVISKSHPPGPWESKSARRGQRAARYKQRREIMPSEQAQSTYNYQKFIREMLSDKTCNASHREDQEMYRFVPQAKKEELLRLIIQDQLSIKDASQKIGLNYSTAKYTIKQYKRSGKIKKVSSFKYTEQQIQQPLRINTLQNQSSNNQTPIALEPAHKLQCIQSLHRQISSTQTCIERSLLLNSYMIGAHPLLLSVLKQLQQALLSVAKDQMTVVRIMTDSLNQDETNPATPHISEELSFHIPGQNNEVQEAAPGS